MNKPLDMPDGEGWWAFEGHYKGRGSEGDFQFAYHIIERNRQLHVDMLLDYDWPVTQLVGKFYRLTMPWDAPQPASVSDGDSLLPCPWCGGEAKIIGAGEKYEGLVFLIKCCRCPATMDFDSVLPELEAIAAWNQRAPQPAAGVPLPDDVLETITSALSEWYIYNHGRKPLVDKALAWLQRQRGAGEKEIV